MYLQNLESDGAPSLTSETSTVTRHVSVLLNEVLSFLKCAPTKNFIDFTLGGGGHTEAILKSTAPDGLVVGVDRDVEALERTGRRLKPYGLRFQPVHSDLSRALETFERFPNIHFNGALMDLGTSSDQLETAERGFSFQQDGPLDMRMDTTAGFTALEWLLSTPEEEIANTLYELSEERFSRRIAKAVVEARKNKKIKTTRDLAEICFHAYPGPARHGRIHPATKTFQAIRIVVNGEFEQIEKGLKACLEKLPTEARLAVISFHSLEDRIVKLQFRQAEQEGIAKILTKKPLSASEAEIQNNPRARSAKLRVLEITRGEA